MIRRQHTLIFLLLLLGACRSQPKEKGEGGGAVTSPTEKEVAAMPPVTNLKATLVNTKVRLTWKSVEGAYGYEIYRQMEFLASSPGAGGHIGAEGSTHQASSVPGNKIDVVSESSYDDFGMETGFAYTYRVVAIGKGGPGAASQPVRVEVVLFPGWVQAPAAGEPQGNPPFDWNNAIGVEGGNSGITEATSYPQEATKYSSCTEVGATLTSVRPSTEVLLGDGDQTFSMDVSYNTDGSDYTLTLAAIGVRDFISDATPLFLKETSLSGCGSIQEAFTADLTGISSNYILLESYMTDSYGDFVSVQILRLNLLNGQWIRLDGTVPVPGTILGGGFLDAQISFANLQRQTITMNLQSDEGDQTASFPYVFGSAATSVEGTGTVSVRLPYRTECGFDSALLRIAQNNNDYVSMEIKQPFEITSTTAFRFHTKDAGYWVARNEYTWLGSISNPLTVYSCADASAPVTLSVGAGWQLRQYKVGFEYVFGNTVTGTSQDSYLLIYKPASNALPDYGTISAQVTANFNATDITTTTFDLHVFDLFWSIRPPNDGSGEISYPVEVTVAGSRPGDSISIDAWSWNTDDQFSTNLVWDNAKGAYSALVTYSTCDTYLNTIDIAVPGYFYLNDYAYTTISENGAYQMSADDSSIYLIGKIGPQDVQFSETCGRAFTWHVVSAPSWLRFQNLQGTNANRLSFGVLPSEAFVGNSTWASGYIQVETNIPTMSTSVYVYASKN